MSTLADFEAIFRLSPNPYMLLDRQLRYVAANDAYLRITARSLADLIGRHILEVFPNDPQNPNDPAAMRLRESLERVVATGKPEVLAFIPYRVSRPAGDAEDGGERFWSATHTPIPDASGAIAYVLQHTVDVTVLYHLEHAVDSRRDPGPSNAVEAGVLERARRVADSNIVLDEQLQHLRRLFEQAPGFICFMRGPDHVIELANSAYHQLVGHRPVIGRPTREALPEVAGQSYFEVLERVFTTGKPFVGRGLSARLRRHPNAEPEEVLLDLVYQPIFDQNGAVAGIFVQGHDITKQKRLLERERAARTEAEAARAEAERANLLKDEFLATLSHELRTPLNALLGWARLLRTRPLDDALRERAAAVIERNAILQAKLVDDVLDVSRIVTGKVRLRVKPIDLSEAIGAAIEVVRPSAECKGVRLEWTPPGPMPYEGDPERLQQVVWNLLSNAIKFTPVGGIVRVDLANRRGHLELTVRDTGIGISPRFLPHVFERFTQAITGNDRTHGGLGLGLALVKYLVEAHGGEIAASSGGDGTGATFTVTLPVSPPHSAAGPEDPAGSRVELVGAAPSAAANLSGVRLLAVGGDAHLLDSLGRLLVEAGATVTIARSAGEALDELSRQVPDVLLSDIRVPGMDGLQLIREIRRRDAAHGGNVPAAAITAYAHPEEIARAVRDGYQLCLSKPVDGPALVAAIAALAEPES